MVKSTLTLLALFNVAILFPGKAMSQNSEGREFNGKYQKEYLDKIAFPIGGNRRRNVLFGGNRCHFACVSQTPS